MQSEKTYFLGLKSLPVINGEPSLTGFSSGVLNNIMVVLKGDYRPLLEFKLQGLMDRINGELRRFEGITGNQPPRFMEYIHNLENGKILFEKAIKEQLNSGTSKYEVHEEEEDYSSPQYTIRVNHNPPKDVNAAIAKIKSYLKDEVQDFIQVDPFREIAEFNFAYHIRLMNEYSRFDLLQRENDLTLVETSFCPKKEEEKEKDEETPLNPNYYSIKIHDVEIYAAYEKTKDAINLLEKKFSKEIHGLIEIEPVSSDQKVKERVKQVIELERKIISRQITTKDFGSFGWYTSKIKTLKAETLWSKPGEIINRRLPPNLNGRKLDPSDGPGKTAKKKRFGRSSPKG